MGKKITYRELEALVNRFAKALTAIGVKAGDKVAMLLPNMPQLVIANYAAFRIGAVPVLNNPLYTEHELAHQLNDSDSSVLDHPGPPSPAGRGAEGKDRDPVDHRLPHHRLPPLPGEQDSSPTSTRPST